MSCVTCDGAGEIDPPAQHPSVTAEGWALTGVRATPCPVCHGPYVREMVAQADARGCDIECAYGDCNEIIDTIGLIVYTQLRSSNTSSLDEAIQLCCEKHGETVAESCRREGHSTVCLPFCADDARG